MLLNNFEIMLDLSCSKDCAISEISKIQAVPANPAVNPATDRVPPTQATKAIFQINNAKLHDPVVTLSINDNIKFSENIKQDWKGQSLRPNTDLK